MRKRCGASALPRRTHWKETAGSLIFTEIDYGTGAHSPSRALARVEDGSEGQFISSLCEDGMHAPALDCDFPVAVRGARHGRTVLEIRHDVPRAAYLKLLAVLRDLGLVAPSWARATIGRVGAGEGPARPEIEFKVPVRALPSSTQGHFHLYVDAEIAPAAHMTLLAAFRDAGLIGADFHAMAERNGMTLLIKPGLTKRDLAPRTPRASGWESCY